MDLIQSNGQPRYGHFNFVPKTIDINRYEYKTPCGDILTGWRKRLKYKKFKFCFIRHEDYTIGIAISDIAWAGHGFFYIYNHLTHDVLDWNALNFLSRKTVLDEQPLFNQSYFHKSPFQIQIEHANGVRYIQLIKFGEIKLSARIFCAGTQALSLCTPNNKNGWTYTQKLMTLNCQGFFMNKKGQMIRFNDRTFASLDDTCGFSTSETARLWLSCNFWDDQNNRIGINLSSSVSERFGNENCLWVNRHLYALTDVVFQQKSEKLWTIRSLDNTLNLTVELGWRRFENLNIRLVGNQFSQWQAKISGIIHIQEQKIELSNEYGLLQKHDAKQ